MSKYDEIILDPNDKLSSPIFNTQKQYGLSDNHVQLTTSELVTAANEAGYLIYQRGCSKRRPKSLAKGLKQETAKHYFAARPSDQTLNKLGLSTQLEYNGGPGRYSKAFPSVLLFNSHDGRTSLSVKTGLLEMVCSNGLVIWSQTFNQFRFNHVNISISVVKEAFIGLLDYLPTLLHIRNRLCEIPVTPALANEFAMRAIPLRWPTANIGEYSEYRIDPNDIVNPRYSNQNGLTFYNLLNNVQRNLLNEDNFHVIHFNKGKKPLSRRVRKVRSFTRQEEINTNLWRLTESFLAEIGQPLDD